MATEWARPGYTFRAAGVDPLPLGDYADPSRYALERARLFRPGRGLLYLGHDLLLPGKGHRRADGDERLLLTRDDDGAVRAVANLCSHSLRPITRDDDFIDRSCITCPYHQWSFRRDGSLIGGRDIAFGADERDRLGLARFDTLAWHGFHFAVDPYRRAEFATELGRIETDFADRGLAEHLDFDGWTILATEDTPYEADWKAFMEVFGDCYHVPPYHPGLASFSDCATLDWTFGEHFHVQFLDIHAERGGRSELYERWIEGLEQYHAARGEPMTEFAVAWLGIYPNLMIELYHGLRVISVVLPTSAGTHVNRAHYCVPSDMETLVPGLAQTMKDAFDETGVEDMVLVETRHQGVVAARELGLDTTPYHVNLTGPAPEAGTAHFYEWYRRELARV
jgi:choline monooxygenase